MATGDSAQETFRFFKKKAGSYGFWPESRRLADAFNVLIIVKPGPLGATLSSRTCILSGSPEDLFSQSPEIGLIFFIPPRGLCLFGLFYRASDFERSLECLFQSSSLSVVSNHPENLFLTTWWSLRHSILMQSLKGLENSLLSPRFNLKSIQLWSEKNLWLLGAT